MRAVGALLLSSVISIFSEFWKDQHKVEEFQDMHKLNTSYLVAWGIALTQCFSSRTSKFMCIRVIDPPYMDKLRLLLYFSRGQM